MGRFRLARLLVTGGAGFLGSAFVQQRLKADPEIELTVLDRLATGEGGLRSVAGDPRLRLLVGDICDAKQVLEAAHDADAIVNFAVEPAERPGFIETNLMGPHVLLEAARRFRHQRFLQVSSGEVYGPPRDGRRREEEPLAPITPLAASRAGAEMLVRAYQTSHGVPILITRGAVTYGPFQPPADGIARWITGLLQEQRVEIGGGSALRDYVHVDDHVAAIARILWKGEPGSVYNVGSGTELSEAEAAARLLELCGKPASYRVTVKDRRPEASHQLDTRRLRPLGWEPVVGFREGLRATIDWYRKTESWWRPRIDSQRPTSPAVAS